MLYQRAQPNKLVGGYLRRQYVITSGLITKVAWRSLIAGASCSQLSYNRVLETALRLEKTFSGSVSRTSPDLSQEEKSQHYFGDHNVLGFQHAGQHHENVQPFFRHG
jgi:hypothetical protein